MEAHDVLAHLDERRKDARSDAAKAYDRTAALDDLYALAFTYAAEQGLETLRPDELHASPENTAERARLDSLIDRALPQED